MTTPHSPLKFITILIVVFSCGCYWTGPPPAMAMESDSDKTFAASSQPEQPASTGCLSCHPFELAVHSSLSCTYCHDGNDQAGTREVAHIGLTSAPAAPDHLHKKCAPCHAGQSADIDHSSHFTMRGEINQVRRHFGASENLDSALDIPPATDPSTTLELADDLLRRRCLRCHVYNRGDSYAATRRGTGCAACHLEYRDGRLQSHRFLAAPDDRRCLSCHYGNRVGADFYGLFEHDFKSEYRTPFQTDGLYPQRPYGVETHSLQPDIHQQAGMTCRDCHTGLHQGASRTVSCVACHEWRPGEPLPAGNLREKDGVLQLEKAEGNGLLSVPRAIDPAHTRFDREIDCAVCHAQWVFNDRGVHLLRIDEGNYLDWDDLIVQGSSEVEEQLLNNLYGNLETAPTMTDKFTGAGHKGLWLKAYETRRWEEPILGRDDNGRLRVLRPSLDLHLSWVDGQGQTVFDSAGGRTSALQPYTPHTMGKAGAFYRLRLKGFITEKDSGTRKK